MLSQGSGQRSAASHISACLLKAAGCLRVQEGPVKDIGHCILALVHRIKWEVGREHRDLGRTAVQPTVLS